MMANADMTTTKIDRSSLSKLKMLAQREHRSQPSQLAVLIDQAFRASPGAQRDIDVFDDMMESMVNNSEQGIVSETARQNAQAFSAAGRISWGEEDGRVIGVMADGTRCDVDGNIIA